MAIEHVRMACRQNMPTYTFVGLYRAPSHVSHSIIQNVMLSTHSSLYWTLGVVPSGPAGMQHAFLYYLYQDSSDWLNLDYSIVMYPGEVLWGYVTNGGSQIHVSGVEISP